MNYKVTEPFCRPKKGGCGREIVIVIGQANSTWRNSPRTTPKKVAIHRDELAEGQEPVAASTQDFCRLRGILEDACQSRAEAEAEAKRNEEIAAEVRGRRSAA
jgi:hypothetical protein